MIRLDALTAEQCEQVRGWRNRDLGGLRTPFPLTREQQADFYTRVVCDRRATDRYWAVLDAHDTFLGMGGLTGIDWGNVAAEISLLLDPEFRGQGYGAGAVGLLLAEAFGRTSLWTVWGECYESNPAIDFWRRTVALYRGTAVMVPRRKFWDGRLWDSYWFTFARETWAEGGGRP